MTADFGSSRVFALPRFDLSPSQGMIKAWVSGGGLLATWDDIAGSTSEVPCATAHFLVSTLVARIVPRGQDWALPSSSEIDWGPGKTPPKLTVDPLHNLAGWERVVALAEQTERALVAAFRAVSPDDPQFEYLAGCGNRVLADSRPSFFDVPTHLRRIGDPVHNRKATLMPFTHRFSPVSTKRLPKARQRRESSFRPMSFQEMLDPSAILEIVDWLHIEGSNMAAIKAAGPEVRRVKNAVRILGYGRATCA
jgi:hypothetical protein